MNIPMATGRARAASLSCSARRLVGFFRFRQNEVGVFGPAGHSGATQNSLKRIPSGEFGL